MASRASYTRRRKELDKYRLIKDEKALQNVLGTIESFTNAITMQDDELINIVSGAVASQEVKRNILTAAIVGEEQCSDYINHRLNDKTVSVFDTMKSLKLKTFSITAKSTAAKSEKSTNNCA